MTARWHFTPARPGERARESQVEKFFSSDAIDNRANAVIREGTQNTLDAATDSEVRVNIRIGRWGDAKKTLLLSSYFAGFDEHLDAVRDKLVEAPLQDTTFRYLAFEDFGTRGLTGDPEQWWIDGGGVSNPFFNFFRGEGISDKDQGSRGRHGVGKFVFARASRVRAMIGLTRRDDGRELLMGTCVLRSHRVNGNPFLPDGWYGVQPNPDSGLVMPIENDQALLGRFRADFGITRDQESGLSVVVPWLSDDVTSESVIEAVLRGFFDPILRRKIRFTVTDEERTTTEIDADTLRSRVNWLGAELASDVLPLIELSEASIAEEPHFVVPIQAESGAPKWAKTDVDKETLKGLSARLDEGLPVVIRVGMSVLKRDADVAEGLFDVVLRRDAGCADGRILFIREGITITDARPKRTPSLRGLVLVDEGPLATLLGDAENPSHTQWQKDLIKDRYFFAPAHIEYVVESIPWLVRLMSDEQKQADPSLLIDLFSLPESPNAGPKAPEKKPRSKPGNETTKPPPLPPPRPKTFTVQKVAGGFAIRRGTDEVALPASIIVKVAYDVRRGNPILKYDISDFRLGKNGVQVASEGADIVGIEDNQLQIVPKADDFHVRVTGFDVNRDLHVAARAIYSGEESVDATQV